MGPWPTSTGVEQALRLVQSFDPTGVAARDLQECLTLQLRQLGLEGTPTERIVTEHLRLLQNHQIPELSRKMGMSIDELREHIEVIRHLDPKPGARYNAAPARVRDARRLHRQGRRSVRRRAQRRRPAAAAHQLVLQAAARQGSGRRRHPHLRQGALQRRALAAEVGGAAAEDHPEGRDQHHQLPARLPRSRHRAPAAAGAARRRQRHRHARVDRQPRRHQQVHAHPARGVRDEVLLPQRHQQLVRRRACRR